MRAAPYERVPVNQLAKTKLCAHFLNGRCLKGQDCNYAHGAQELSGEGLGLGGQLWKTKMCTHFLQGHCKKGLDCNFAHSQNELAPHADFSFGGNVGGMVKGASQLPKEALAKTKLCTHFLSSGACSKGTYCNFAHSALELRGSAPVPPTPTPVKSQKLPAAFAPMRKGGKGVPRVVPSMGTEYQPVAVLAKTKLCAHFESGNCKKGEGCNYAHGAAELKAA
ncbi:unnamed protein product [Effrenium voratum]|uniref:C3H1-type domain-containing protein n=1 Tax=Effrenium voratum TaxID=2562239 RepID=A0AA36IQ42_9DINO|nr:unnamed protein product [Effrenium voratum]